MTRVSKLTVFAISIFCISLFVTSSVFAAPNSRVFVAPNPFIGKWYNLDPDGSTQRMTIGGGNDQNPITYFDDAATFCTPDAPPPVYPVKLLGKGTIDGSSMTADLDIWCLTGPFKGYMGRITVYYEYDADTDTITDSLGDVWLRNLPPPNPDDAPPNPFLGKWYYLDPDGSTVRMTVGGGNDQHPITYFDDAATFCTPDAPPPVYPVKLLGVGTINGSSMTANLDIWCLTGPRKGFKGSITIDFQYDPNTDTVTDSLGEVWFRNLPPPNPDNAPPNPFLGKWYYLDPDGSTVRMTIGGGNDQHPITYFDDAATFCTPDAPPPVYPVKLLGVGILDGSSITADLDIWCLTGPRKGFKGSITINFQYDPGTDTITDSLGEVWFR
jgi:hypothetical protein